MKKSKLRVCIAAAIFFPLVGLAAGCQKKTKPDPFPCNYDGFCQPEEDRRWCPDCELKCYPPKGETYDYIISEIIYPEDSDEEIGIDLTGDGEINNRMAVFIGILPEIDVNEMTNETIQSGAAIMLGRLWVSDWKKDEAVMVQLLRGTSDATEQLFQMGSNHATIAGDVDRTLHICGEISDGYLDSGLTKIEHAGYVNGPLKMQIFLVLGDLIMELPLEYPKIVSADFPVTPNSWSNVTIAGGLSEDTMENIFIPKFAEFLNKEALDDPEGKMGYFATEFMDGNCSTTPEGCEEVVNGEGECTVWDPVNEPEGPVITETEVRCSNLIATAVKPDLDSNGDGIKDLWTIGFVASAFPITIDE